jgi:hypothetical protein
VIDRRELARKIFEGLFACGCLAYIVVFAWRQTPGLFLPTVLEWDTRTMALPAWRYHGTGLFAGDYITDFASIMDTPLWHFLFWVGTLFTNPFVVSKLLPFVLLGVVVWQGFCLGRRWGGLAMGALTALLLVHCTIVWDRLLGANSRAFGFPLVVAFLRYAFEGAEYRTLTILLLQAAGYPSAFLVCAPAYGLTLLWPRGGLRLMLPPLLRFGAAAGLGLVIMALSLYRVDARFGHPPSLAEAATLPQMGPGGNQPFYPLAPARHAMRDALDSTFVAGGSPLVPRLAAWHQQHRHVLVWGLLAALALVAWRRLRHLPPVLAALLASSLLLFWLARLLAYRLYLPDRMLVYAWPPLFVALLVALAGLAGQRISRQWGCLGVAVLVVVFHFSFEKDGLPRSFGMRDWRANETPTVRFLAKLPKDTLVAADLRTSSFIQCFALRRTLFSSVSNVSNYYGYAKEMDRRIGDYYRAYYAADVDTVRSFARTHGVSYLVVNQADFGPVALARSRFHEPWTTLAAQLLRRTPPGQMVLAHPPLEAVAFRDGSMLVIDLRRL